MRNEHERELEDLINYYLQDMTFEEFLEYLDLTPTEVFLHMLSNGLIIEEDLESLPHNVG